MDVSLMSDTRGVFMSELQSENIIFDYNKKSNIVVK